MAARPSPACGAIPADRHIERHCCIGLQPSTSPANGSLLHFPGVPEVRGSVLPAALYGPTEGGSKVLVRHRMQGWMLGVPVIADCCSTPSQVMPTARLLPRDSGSSRAADARA